LLKYKNSPDSTTIESHYLRILVSVRAEIKKGRIPAEKIGKEYRIPVED